jgi:hypothetical protein
MSKTKAMANFAAIASQLLSSVITQNLIDSGNATHEGSLADLFHTLFRSLYAIRQKLARYNATRKTGISTLTIPLAIGQAEAFALRDGLDFATFGEEGGDQVVRVRFHELNIGPL